MCIRDRLIAVIRERLGHRCHIVGIGIDRVNTLVGRKVRRAGFERVLHDLVFVELLILVIDDDDALLIKRP